MQGRCQGTGPYLLTKRPGSVQFPDGWPAVSRFDWRIGGHDAACVRD